MVWGRVKGPSSVVTVLYSNSVINHFYSSLMRTPKSGLSQQICDRAA